MFLILQKVGVERKYPSKVHLPYIGKGPLRCHKLVYGLNLLLLFIQPRGYYRNMYKVPQGGHDTTEYLVTCSTSTRNITIGCMASYVRRLKF